MTYEEFQRQLGKACLTIREFAELVKMSRISVSNYKQKGQVPSHLAIIACLLGEMAERKIDYRGVLSRINILPKKARGVGVGKFGGADNSQQDLFSSNHRQHGR